MGPASYKRKLMLYTKNGGYGAFLGPKETGGKVFIVYSENESNAQVIRELWEPDSEGKSRSFTNFTDALAACTAGRGDKIFVTQGYTTAPTLTELATANTKQVLIEQIGGKLGNDYVTTKAATTLPATTTGTLFTVTGMVKILDLIGEVTTTVQTQACNAKLQAIPTVGSTQDLCAVANITALVTGTALFLSLNDTTTPAAFFANALQVTAPAVFVNGQKEFVVPAGTIGFNTSATNTGAVKWVVRYLPLLPGSRVF